MTTTATHTSTAPVRTSTTTSTIAKLPALWRPALVAGLIAAAATAALAGTAHAAGVSLDVAGEPIPVAGFANLTLMCVAVGYLIALAARRWAANPHRTFTITSLALVAVSFVPDLVVSAAVETRLTLMAAHVVAAAIVIPALARRLDDHRS